jgi:hypothetical protein
MQKMQSQAIVARWLRMLTGIVAIAALSGCASVYVDNHTKEVESSKFGKTNPPHPVQVLFEFQTKGVANARATEALKKQVLDQVQASQVFTSVGEGPVDGNALLSITLNNVPLTDDAFSKGFVTGLTFGLAGSQVSDGYVCTAKYSGPGQQGSIAKSARHAIHTVIGNGSAPPDATKASDVMEAVKLMTRQIVSNVLHDVTNDVAFK